MPNRILIPDASRADILVVIGRPMGDPLQTDHAGHRPLRAGIGHWGIDTDGNPYFDRHAATQAERATPTLDTQDRIVLIPERTINGELVSTRRGAGRAYPSGTHTRFADGPLTDPRPVRAAQPGQHVRYAAP